MLKRDIIQIPITPSYKKENGVFVIKLSDIEFPPDFNLKETNFISIPPHEIGGNHFHPRQEAFISLHPGLEIVWRFGTEDFRVPMTTETDIMMFIIPPHLPHAIINTSNTPATIIEFADGEQVNVEKAHLIS